MSIPLVCADCGKTVRNPVTSAANSTPDGSPQEGSVEFWWCRDCLQGVCKQCHLMKGHSEHRANEWKTQEIYRACSQALEGRCSHRSKLIHEHKIHVKEFIAKVEVFLLNELGRHLERTNEPDRRLISRLNRALTCMELQDDRPSLYHIPSPSRPAWKTWNLDQDDPTKMHELIENVSDLLQLPREDNFQEEEIMLKDRGEWNVRAAAETIALSLGTHISTDNLSMMSRTTTPDVRSTWEERRRGTSVDSSRNLPLEPSVFVRDRPSVMSFRERSLPSEAGSNDRDSFVSPVASNASFDSKPGSVMSSIPMYPYETSTVTSETSVTPTPFLDEYPTNVRCFGRKYLTRPICVQSFNTKSRKSAIAISDSCGGVYVTTREGEIKDHVLIKNSSASSIAFDEKNELMYVSVMQAKGRSIHVFDIASNFKKLDVIACPKDPKVEISRTRWITVAPRGHLFMTTGDNIKSALWCYVRARKGWKTLKESRKTRYQYLSVAEDQAEYKAVVLLTCDAANNRLLLFVVDHSLSLINEYDLSKTYCLPDHISSPASAIVDVHGNLLILDYATGKLWILLSGVKGIRRLKQIHLDRPIEPQEALGIAVMGDDVFVACFGQREIRVCPYLEGGVFCPPRSNRSPSMTRRSSSLPRPPESQL